MLPDYFYSSVIGDFLRSYEDVFTIDEFCKIMKSKGAKISRANAYELLTTSEFVFSLVNKQFITRAGVFTGKLFSFKPSKEEVEKGYFILGHRCMPFITPEITSDNYTVTVNGKEIPSESKTFTMNLAMDTFAMYGEGYIVPRIFNDKGNTSLALSSVQYSLPQEINLTAWPLKAVAWACDFKYGDRILCRVTNWAEGVIEMFFQPLAQGNLIISSDYIEREEWYTHFENGIIKSIEKNGPCSSIEDQLSTMFLENLEELCVENCGSSEEFLAHTKKIGFSNYGVESRIWYEGKDVPYVGNWNKNFMKDLIASDVAAAFSPPVIDAFIDDLIYSDKIGEKTKIDSFESLMQEIFPQFVRMSREEKKVVLLNLKKRHDILLQNYNQFSDYSIAPVRKRILNLFKKVSSLIGAISVSGISVELFPQQEIVVLIQLYSHIARLLEEVENQFIREDFPIDDVSLSLEGMEDTFDGIYMTLKTSLDKNINKGFVLVD